MHLQFGLNSALLKDVLYLLGILAHPTLHKLVELELPLLEVEVKVFRESLVDLLPVLVRKGVGEAVEER